jgi:hypothetical protein
VITRTGGACIPPSRVQPALAQIARHGFTALRARSESFPNAAEIGREIEFLTLFTGEDEKIDVDKVAVSMNGIELQDREFFAAIREGREPNASVEQVLPCYRTLDQLEKQLA